MLIEFPVPINLSDRQYLQLDPEFANQIVAHGRVLFYVCFPFERSLERVVQKGAWSLRELLCMFDVLYKFAYAEEDKELVHEISAPCNCSTVLDESDFSFSRCNEDSCRICLSDRMSSKLILPCGHCFHVRCIREWFRQKNACPLCQQPIAPCEDCNSKRTIEIRMTENQLRWIMDEPRRPTTGPFGINALHYEELYFSGVHVRAFGDVYMVVLKPYLGLN